MVQIRRTISIRAGKGVSVGGGHLHHYTWGIGLLPFVGAVAVRGDERQRRHLAVAVSYGTGNALIVDEFALLGRKGFKPLKKGMILVGRPAPQAKQGFRWEAPGRNCCASTNPAIRRHAAAPHRRAA